MQIAKDRVVRFHYQLKENDGTLIENSNDSDPVAYLHGHGNIISGLERELEGAEVGQSLTVTVAPEDGYGLRNEEAVQRIPIKHLHEQKNLKPGMVVHVHTDEGPRQVIVLKAGKFNIDADLNHPLAGKTLVFEVRIDDVREATEEELHHKHAHGVGGHQH